MVTSALCSVLVGWVLSLPVALVVSTFLYLSKGIEEV